MDGKTTYAQSSDIKSRTYLEYKKDMKKKAVVELELLDWIKDKVKREFNDKTAMVQKGGGDAFVWFLRKGGITREPDYQVTGENNFNIELQYGKDIDKKSIFDFKISKVTKKIKGNKKRKPLENVIFLYLFKDQPDLYSFLKPEWIYRNGKVGVAPAWGNREVYKIPGNKMLKQIKKDTELKKVWGIINMKLNLLEFQHDLINFIKEQLSYLLQTVIDKKEIVKIVPNNLESFFKICFILDSINKISDNASLWLVYLLSYVNEKNTTEELYKILYCIDFLYSKVKLHENELNKLIGCIQKIQGRMKALQQNDGTFKSSTDLSPKEEIKFVLFAINLLEDLVQDIIYYYGTKKLKPVQRIYQSINNIEKIYQIIN